MTVDPSNAAAPARPYNVAAYAAGQKARQKGASWDDNPHPLGTPEHRAWSEGWDWENYLAIRSRLRTKSGA